MSVEMPPGAAREVVERLEDEVVDLDAVLAAEPGRETAQDAVRTVPGSPEPPD